MVKQNIITGIIWQEYIPNILRNIFTWWNRALVGRISHGYIREWRTYYKQFTCNTSCGVVLPSPKILYCRCSTRYGPCQTFDPETGASLKGAGLLISVARSGWWRRKWPISYLGRRASVSLRHGSWAAPRRSNPAAIGLDRSRPDSVGR